MMIGACSKVDVGEVNNLKACEACHTQAINSFKIHRDHLSFATMKGSALLYDNHFRDTADTALQTTRKLQDSLFKIDTLLADSLTPNTYTCNTCHTGYEKTGNFVNPDLHMNGKLDISFTHTYFDSALKEIKGPGTYNGDNCTMVACHTAGRIGKENVVWKDTVRLSQNLDCNGCHDATKHKLAGTTQKRCGVCHKSAVDKTKISNYRYHINGILEKN